ncbi:Protein of unknown function DUF262/Protein of unknown function DUF1524 [Myroides sp. A21]|uniref:DUF262 domain-containing protein n=1 Tax=Myroides sp. A21 TaxID=1583100 RepID=UPI00057D8232|nr:DUF262 domain-containing HNH endonuclease family protein [Myroides sp. A21]AJA69345.1 Protein of unknown function DUF262/Protein of unknown function DUF1524 [Myroides sp. A21]
MSEKINIETYFKKGLFVIPEYQRGYKWSVETNNTSSLEFFIDSLINASNLKEYFIEAVTVVEENGNIILVDGQQRTTSLYLLFAVLEEFELITNKLKYDIREDSHKWLNNLIIHNNEEFQNIDTQDIFYFNKALELIKVKLKENNTDKQEFLKFVKQHVFLLYNPIPKEKAINTFISLNGLKALMRDEELIKSELLIKSSRIEIQTQLSTEEQLGLEWKINEDRGTLARNWDKWLYWWNRSDVKTYFNTGNRHPMYYLLITYAKINYNTKETIKDLTFDSFKHQFISNSLDAKKHFDGLRKLQKTFEDLYHNFESHNFLGIILKTSNSKEDALHYFLNPSIDKKLSLEDYAKWSLVRATHLEIINNNTEKIENSNRLEEMIAIKKIKAQESINLIDEKYVYSTPDNEAFNDNRKEIAFRFLLLMNILEDTKLKRKFDFSIWNNRSLEHIYPKSKASDLNFEQEAYNQASIHCIGNLVLLYGDDNSSFGPKTFLEKKMSYFNTSEKFKSRHLLHTVSVFANSQWTENNITENKQSIIKQLNNYYELN